MTLSLESIHIGFGNAQSSTHEASDQVDIWNQDPIHLNSKKLSRWQTPAIGFYWQTHPTHEIPGEERPEEDEEEHKQNPF